LADWPAWQVVAVSDAFDVGEQLRRQLRDAAVDLVLSPRQINHVVILGVSCEILPDDPTVKMCYHHMMKLVHPDKNDGSERATMATRKLANHWETHGANIGGRHASEFRSRSLMPEELKLL
jgi:hypothetical protein